MHSIDLRKPLRSERVRDFQPPRRTVWIYRCEKTGKDVRVRASAFRGSQPVPTTGAILCPHCANLNPRD